MVRRPLPSCRGAPHSPWGRASPGACSRAAVDLLRWPTQPQPPTPNGPIAKNADGQLARPAHTWMSANGSTMSSIVDDKPINAPPAPTRQGAGQAWTDRSIASTSAAIRRIRNRARICYPRSYRSKRTLETDAPTNRTNDSQGGTTHEIFASHSRGRRRHLSVQHSTPTTIRASRSHWSPCSDLAAQAIRSAASLPSR